MATITANFNGHEVKLHMGVTSYARGNKIYEDDDNVWRYCADDSLFDDGKPCIRCGKMPNADYSDACVGHIDGVRSACCGHGAERPFVMFNNCAIIYGEDAEKLFKER